MSAIHQHRWVEIARAYAPPYELGQIKIVQSAMERAPSTAIRTISAWWPWLERAKSGVTTLLLKCECGAIRQHEMLGKSVGSAP